MNPGEPGREFTYVKETVAFRSRTCRWCEGYRAARI